MNLKKIINTSRKLILLNNIDEKICKNWLQNKLFDK